MGRPKKGERHIYGPVNNPSDIRKHNQTIRRQIRKAKERANLTELVKRSQYFVTMAGGWDHSTPSPAWRNLVKKYPNIGEVANNEYLRTCREANRRAKKMGLQADYGPD